MQTLTTAPTTGLRPSCPAWCDGSCRVAPAPEPFHTLDVAEVEMRDADLVDEPFTAWVAVETLDDRPAHIRVNLRPSRSRPHDQGLELTPEQAIELGRALVLAGIVARRDGGA
jgi:hypothetical protein